MYSVENLGKQYGKQCVLSGINLKLKAGQFVSLMGPNGSGKSTLLRLLAQQEVYESGEIYLSGESFKSTSLKINSQLFFVSEDHELPFDESIRDWSRYLSYSSANYNKEIFELLSHRFSVDTSKTFSILSRGQKMKALFALHAAKRPNIYLLDEITSVLDSGSRLRLMEFLVMEVKRGCLVVVSTNIASEMQGFATDVCFLDHTNITLNCRVDEFYQHFTKVKSIGALSPELLIRMMPSAAKKVALNSDGTWSFLTPITNVDALPRDLVMPDKRMITIEDVAAYFTSGME